MTLRVLATCDSKQTIGFSCRLGHATFKKIYHETCETLLDVLKGDYVRFPSTEKWKEIAVDFEKFWSSPLLGDR